MTWIAYTSWTALSFAVAFILNSFIEWAAHRFILHSPKIMKLGYDLHDRQHHVIFDGEGYYHAKDDFMRSHVTFVLRDYVLFLLVTTPIWIAAELLIGRPVIAGGILATLAGLQLFNSLHLRFHCPKESRFQRTWFFLYLKEHHRKHHKDSKFNYNVAFFPIADWVLGTKR